MVQRALVLQVQGVIEEDHLHLNVNVTAPTSTATTSNTNAKSIQINEFELIKKTLAEHQGNRQKVAAALGVSERTLRYKLAKMREEGYVV